jgi:hypothetical protein
MRSAAGGRLCCRPHTSCTRSRAIGRGSTSEDVLSYLNNVRLHSLAKVESIKLDKREDVLIQEHTTKGVQSTGLQDPFARPHAR